MGGDGHGVFSGTFAHGMSSQSLYLDREKQHQNGLHKLEAHYFFHLCYIFIGKHHILVAHTNLNSTYTTRQGSLVSCLAQADFAAFGNVVQLISWSPYAETEQLSRLTSPSGILATS